MTLKPIDRTRPPRPGPIRPFRFPEIESRVLANGVRLLAARMTGSPIVNAKVLVPTGGEHNPPSRPGLANVLGVLLHQGTAHMSGHDLVQAVERYGGSMESGAGWDAGFVEARLLAEHLEPCLGFLIDSVRVPALDEASSKRVRGQHHDHVRRRLSTAQAWAEDVFSLLVYGESAYAYPLAGTPESLRAMEHSEILDFSRRLLGPRGSSVVVVGAIETRRVLDQVEALVEEWASEGPAPEPPGLDPVWPEKRTICVVDLPKAVQTSLIVGHAGLPGHHPDHFALSFLSSVLGGGITSRLNRSLREERGLTYGIQSTLASRRGPGPFSIKTAVETPSVGTAVAEILRQVQLLADVPISTQELSEIHGHVQGALPISCQTLTGASLQIEQLALQGLPFDLLDSITERYASLEVGFLQRVAHDHLRPDRCVVVAVGPADQLRPQLEPMGDVLVHRLG